MERYSLILKLADDEGVVRIIVDEVVKKKSLWKLQID